LGGGSLTVYNFEDMYKISMGKRGQSDIDTIKSILSCSNVQKTNTDIDLQGVDYIATLRNGAKINIDAKTRTKGCSRYWKNNMPELALEKWSIVNKKTGWTLSESSPVDYILFTFYDVKECYLLPFQLLRVAFRRNIKSWYKSYKVDIQKSTSGGNSWQSECVFVPVNVVIDEINKLMIQSPS